jgi:hypothetical protein
MNVSAVFGGMIYPWRVCVDLQRHARPSLALKSMLVPFQAAMRGPYGARRQGRSIAASLPKAPHHAPPSFLHLRTSFLSLSFSPKLLVANLGVKVSGQVGPITFSSFGNV